MPHRMPVMNEPQIPLEPQGSVGFVARSEDKGGGILPLGQHAYRFNYLCVSNVSPDALVTDINQHSVHGWEVVQILLNGTTFVAFLKRPQ